MGSSLGSFCTLALRIVLFVRIWSVRETRAVQIRTGRHASSKRLVLPQLLMTLVELASLLENACVYIRQQCDLLRGCLGGVGDGDLNRWYFVYVLLEHNWEASLLLLLF